MSRHVKSLLIQLQISRKLTLLTGSEILGLEKSPLRP